MPSSGDEAEALPVKIGDTFASVADAKDAVKRYGAALYADFRVNTNNKTCLRYFCKHGGRVKDKKGTGERIKQHYNHMGCTASIMFYKSQKNGSLTCTKIASEHNHAVSESIYNQANVQLDEE